VDQASKNRFRESGRSRGNDRRRPPWSFYANRLVGI